MLKIILLLALFHPSLVLSAPESDYRNKYCEGKMEMLLADGTRVDCLTDSHAIEFDFGKKWAEAIGQSLHYAMYTGRRAGIYIIVDPSENRFVNRLNATIKHYNLPIDVWLVEK